MTSPIHLPLTIFHLPISSHFPMHKWATVIKVWKMVITKAGGWI